MKQKQTTITLISFGLLVILFTGCAKRPGQIELSATEYDFGTIPNNTVTFDANFHATRGEVTRLVWFATNDPAQPWVEVRIIADVL